MYQGRIRDTLDALYPRRVVQRRAKRLAAKEVQIFADRLHKETLPHSDDKDLPDIIRELYRIAHKLAKGAAVLLVALLLSGYTRSEWKHWISDRCSARELVLIQDAESIDRYGCDIEAGVWVCPYTGKVLYDKSDVDIDHIIPLGYAGEHGGDAWSSKKKRRYANDPTVLIATWDRENQAKGRRGPSEYMPPLASYRAEYLRRWREIAAAYGIELSFEDAALVNSAVVDVAPLEGSE